jgi:hypothetical protein
VSRCARARRRARVLRVIATTNFGLFARLSFWGEKDPKDGQDGKVTHPKDDRVAAGLHEGIERAFTELKAAAAARKNSRT